MKRAAWAWVVLAGAMLAPGCCRPPEHRVSLETLVAAHNANADAVPKVWARAKIAVTMQDPASGVPFTWGSTSPLVTPNGLLVMVKGADRLGVQDFVLIGQEANIDLFRLGASTEENKYYFWLRAGARGRAWWGRLDHAGAPGVSDIPIDPTQLLAALNVCDLPANATDIPAAGMVVTTEHLSYLYDSPWEQTFAPCKHAYVVTSIDRQPISRRIGFSRETYFLWSDTAPRRPFLIRYLDENGWPVMTARLGEYEPVPGATGKDLPVMPTDIRLEWPARHTSVHIVLAKMTTDKGVKEACRFQDFLPEGLPVEQVDKALEAGQSKPVPPPTIDPGEER
ncbi:MAG: hypothetical protein NT031_01140 [Planctomycetota bacterium]|nr:hypothetical protein [Planctomycetota bacterium]